MRETWHVHNLRLLIHGSARTYCCILVFRSTQSQKKLRDFRQSRGSFWWRLGARSLDLPPSTAAPA